MVKNGSYIRFLPVNTKPEKDRVYRKSCGACKIDFTLLPEDVVPLHSYGLDLIASRITASIDGRPQTSRQFYEEWDLIPEFVAKELDSPGLGNAWSDLHPTLCPSHQLFRHWARKFSSVAQALLPALLAACLQIGCDLRLRLGESLQSFHACPTGIRPFLLATGLLALVREDSVLECIPAGLSFLGFNIESHKISRAAGRPPPQYGGDLDWQQLQAHFREEIKQ